MVSGAHTIQINASVDTVWDYLADFGNWAPYVIGYRSMEAVDETTSRWVLKGDVGVLAREVELEVQVLSWEPGRQASFSITGVTERLDGTGSFAVAIADTPAGDEDDETREARAAHVANDPEARGWWQRLKRRLALRLLRRVRGPGGPAVSPVTQTRATKAAAAAANAEGGAWCALTFTLDVSPGGPMAPMVEMLMKPLLEPAAEDLSTQIRSHIEGASRV